MVSRCHWSCPIRQSREPPWKDLPLEFGRVVFLASKRRSWTAILLLWSTVCSDARESPVPRRKRIQCGRIHAGPSGCKRGTHTGRRDSRPKRAPRTRCLAGGLCRAPSIQLNEASQPLVPRRVFQPLQPSEFCSARQSAFRYVVRDQPCHLEQILRWSESTLPNRRPALNSVGLRASQRQGQ
jgi:hypothetical protein